ncbi:MAG: hypothetical protein KME21_19985 [Desmonostoc vinosum HA7617-LM4]|nr:hypothetical protein [Desmonostoc vinosum HA7617-LM4]
MTTNRQLKQPQSTLDLEYFLLHNGRRDLPATNTRLVRANAELLDFYDEAGISGNDP